MTDPVMAILEEGRRREKVQTLFYRTLAAEAEAAGEEDLVERLNALHADEQHHLSRLTARVLELGGVPGEVPSALSELPSLEGWEGEGRARELDEVAWYRDALTGALDDDTGALFQEILESEEHHSRELGGKWMSA